MVLGLALMALGVMTLGADAWAAPPVVEAIRIGKHPDKTRIVLDLSQTLFYRLTLASVPERVIIDMPVVKWGFDPRLVPRRGVVAGMRIDVGPTGGGRLELIVTGPLRIHRHFLLQPAGKSGHRLVIDLVAATPPQAVPMSMPEGLPEPRPGFGIEDGSFRGAVGGGTAAFRPIPPRPRSRPYRPMIVIDPGHGGIDPGTIGANGVMEKDIVLRFALALARQLRLTGRYRVKLTREKDAFLRLRDRMGIARKAAADLFLSLHADSLADPDFHGAAVYTLSDTASDKEAEALAAKENKADLITGIDLSESAPEVSIILIELAQRETQNLSIQFAGHLVGALRPVRKMLRKPRRSAGFVVLKAVDIPSVLLELGYLSNTKDLRVLTSPRHQEKIVGAIVAATDSYIRWKDRVTRQ